MGGPDRFTNQLGFQHIIDVHRHLRITDDQRERFVALYLEALDEAGLPNDQPFRHAVREHVEFGAHVAQQNSWAETDAELHPIRQVPRGSGPRSLARARFAPLGVRSTFRLAMASGEPTGREQIAEGLKEHPARNGIRFNVLVTAVEIGGSLGLFHLARRMGASDVASYLIGSSAPVVGGFMVWARARKFSGASAAIFAFTALSAIVALIGSTAPKVLLYKDCATTALIGLIFLGSCVLVRKPLVFYMAQRYGTDGTHEGMAVFDQIWDVSRDFRTCMYVISYLWAVLFLIQAAGTALIIRQTRYSTAYTYDQTLPLVAIGLGVVASIAIGRHFNNTGQASGGADADPRADRSRPSTPWRIRVIGPRPVGGLCRATMFARERRG